jgi:hypothetical protein
MIVWWHFPARIEREARARQGEAIKKCRPSCGGRRMADTAAWLVDRVLPWVPYRQWVLSLPFALRYRMAYDSALMTAICKAFAGGVFSEYYRRARQAGVTGKTQCGAVTFVQRFGSALNLNVHFHMIACDGVYAGVGRPEFYELDPPADADVLRVVALTAHRVRGAIERRGLHEEADRLWEEDPGLASLYTTPLKILIARLKYLSPAPPARFCCQMLETPFRVSM